jgi:hypothetical protein
MGEWHGPLFPREVLDHRGKWVVVDSRSQPPRILRVCDTYDDAVGWVRSHGLRALVFRVPTEDEPELVGAG